MNMSGYRRKPRVATIYRIRCTATNKSYIGSTLNAAPLRWANHMERLTEGRHNRAFQEAWNTHGPTAWEFSIVETNISPEKQFDQEEHWFRQFDCAYNGTSKIYRLVRRADAIQQVLELVAEGKSYRQIQALVQISPATISNIVRDYELVAA